jgi:hypothetical protein
MHGFRMLILSSFSALTFYSLVYLLVNLIQTEYSQFTIPLLYQYVLMRSGSAAIPILFLILVLTCFQLFYDLQMTTEHMLMFYRELKYKSYSTRLERLEKVRYLGKQTLDNLDTGESKALFSTALEEVSVRTKAWIFALILLINAGTASMGGQSWFYIVFMGSSTCPFLAYVVPAYLYQDLKRKQGANSYPAIAFMVLGVLMMIMYTSVSVFAWHVKVFIPHN